MPGASPKAHSFERFRDLRAHRFIGHEDRTGVWIHIIQGVTKTVTSLSRYVAGLLDNPMSLIDVGLKRGK